MRARAREARRGAVLAQQQPALGGRGVAALGRLDGDRVGAAEEPGADGAAGGGERDLVAGAGGAVGVAQARRSIALVGVRVGLARSSRAARRRRRRARARGVARGLRRGRRGRARSGRRRARRRRCPRPATAPPRAPRGDDASSDGAAPASERPRIGQFSSLSPSWPAAWETWPAIASALRCASEPSVSASEAVNFLPPSSSLSRRPANWCRFSRSTLVCCACSALTFSIARLDVVVDQDDAAEDVADVAAGARWRRSPSPRPCRRR